jgi:chemotaxis signal transduction protein
MTSTSPLVANKIAELRSAFDRTYSIAPSSQGVEQIENLLAIRVAGDPYAMWVREISGLANNRKTVALPSSVPELLGVASMRGGFVPVYSLAALLGYSQDLVQGRWLALCGSQEPVGVAFSDFEGYLRVPSTQIYAAEQMDAGREHVKQVVRAAGTVRAVISMAHLLETIRSRCGEHRVSKEP